MGRFSTTLAMYCISWMLWFVYLMVSFFTWGGRMPDVEFMWYPSFFGLPQVPPWYSIMWIAACYAPFVVGIWALIDPRGNSTLYHILNAIPQLCLIYVAVNMFIVMVVGTVGIALTMIDIFLNFIKKMTS